MTDQHDRVEVYEDKAGDIRWRYVEHDAENTLADSGQGYSDERDALHGAARVLGGALTETEGGHVINRLRDGRPEVVLVVQRNL